MSTAFVFGCSSNSAKQSQWRNGCNCRHRGKYHGKSMHISDDNFPSIIEDKVYVHESWSKKIVTTLSDHEQLIETFPQLRQLFPLHMKVQRRRKRDPEIHVSNSSLTRIAHIENREHVRVGPEVDMSMDVVGTVDETEGSQDVGSFVEQDVGSFVGQDVMCCDGIGSNVGTEPSSSLRRRLPKHKRQQQQRR